MNNNLTELIFILDRSGSMQHLTKETIGGFNSLVEKQKLEGEAYLTTVLFDDHYEILHNHLDIQQVPTLTQKEYYVRGCTALLDAVGKTIDLIGKRLAETPEENRPGKVIFTITTDGEENASRIYSHRQIQQMITHQRTVYNWEFVFLGANIDAVETAESIGIPQHLSRTYSATPTGCCSTYTVMNKLIDYLKTNTKENVDFEYNCEEILSDIE